VEEVGRVATAAWEKTAAAALVATPDLRRRSTVRLCQPATAWSMGINTYGTTRFAGAPASIHPEAGRLGSASRPDQKREAEGGRDSSREQSLRHGEHQHQNRARAGPRARGDHRSNRVAPGK
jgi:hypothetical protein